MPKDGTAVLDAAIENNMDAPFSCKAGVCSTCRAKVLEGEVEMEINHALEDYEVRARLRAVVPVHSALRQGGAQL